MCLEILKVLEQISNTVLFCVAKMPFRTLKTAHKSSFHMNFPSSFFWTCYGREVLLLFKAARAPKKSIVWRRHKWEQN